METFFARLFASNSVVLTAVYGQVFFVLGLSVALQWRRESRLELARSVPLLAAFGLTNAFAIWADIFIPQQETLLVDRNIDLLRLLQLLLMLMSYAFLLHFGLRLNWSDAWTPRLPWLLGVIGVVLLVAAFLNGAPPEWLRVRFEQVARPLFLFTGALLAAWGIRNAAREVEAMGLPRHIVTWLRVAGASLGVYALFGGLVVPLDPAQPLRAAPTMWGVPAAIPRLLAIGVLAWAMIQALTIFRVELQRAMDELARLRALAIDRQRIGRDLHDGTIQAIYGAGLLLESGLTNLRQNPDMAEEMLRSAITLLNTTIQDVRRYIFELSDNEGQLAEALGLLVSEMQAQSRAAIEYRFTGALPRYPDEIRHHLVQIAREAITNAIKHSGADEIIVAITGRPDALLMEVSDNGRGLPPGGAFRPGGQGVPNLRARTALLGGSIRWLNRPGGGLVVEIVVPYQEEMEARPQGERGPHQRWKDEYESSTYYAG